MFFGKLEIGEGIVHFNTKKIIKIKNKEISVIIPDNIEGVLNNQVVFDADRKGLNSIMMSALMIKKKNIIVYFPLQKNDITHYWAKRNSNIIGEKLIYDVVFMHHSTQIPVSEWKKIKQAFKYSKSIRESFEVNINSEYNACENEYKKFEKTERYYKRKDVFLHCSRFDTCFFIGGLFSYMQLFMDLKDMLELPLEENLKTGAGFDYVYFIEDGKRCGYDFHELGFFDNNLK